MKKESAELLLKVLKNFDPSATMEYSEEDGEFYVETSISGAELSEILQVDTSGEDWTILTGDKK